MKTILLYLSAITVLALGVGASFALAGNPHGEPPGQGDCSHGATGKPCKPDPQPEHGKDCEKHGKNGGVNEDHCKPPTTPTDTTPTTPTDTTPTTPTDTTPTTPTDTVPTTPTDTVPTTTTPVETTPTVTTITTAPPTTPVTETTVVTPSVVKKKKKVAVVHPKPDKPKVAKKKAKIVKVSKPNKQGLVKIKLSNGKTVTGVMGSG